MNRFLNKRVLIVLGIVLLVLFAWAAFTFQQQAKTPDDESYEYTDTDTGEVISVKPGVTDETYGSNKDQVTVIGLSSLSKFGSISLNQNQLPLFRKDLEEKGIKALGTHDSIVKVVDPKLNFKTYLIEADFIYKKGVEPALLIFDIKNNYEFRYEIWVGGTKTYGSGQLSTTNVGEIPPENH
jgi:hypothetical protein